MDALPLHPAVVHLPLGLAVLMPLLAAGFAWAAWTGRVGVNVRVFLAQPSLASVGSMTVKAPQAWAVKEAADREAQGGRGRREVPTSSARFEVSVPATAAITQPYFLEQPRQGDN